MKYRTQISMRRLGWLDKELHRSPGALRQFRITLSASLPYARFTHKSILPSGEEGSSFD